MSEDKKLRHELTAKPEQSRARSSLNEAWDLQSPTLASIAC